MINLISKLPNYILLFLIPFLFIACEQKSEPSIETSTDWVKREASLDAKDSLELGKTYLSIYSQIYSFSEHKTHNLTALVSLRNTSDQDTIFILKAEYYGTNGNSIRKYLENPIYISPLETLEIVIDEVDVSGGTGSNFIFEWNVPRNCSEPLFEAIMSSTLGQQGLSFTTQGVRIK